LYMGDFLWLLMKKRKMQMGGEWVFPSAKSKTGHIVNISKFRKKINEQSNISFTFQDLRRTFNFIASNLSNEPIFIKNTNEKKIILESDHVVHDQDMRHKMNRIEQIVLSSYRDELIALMNINS
ncbi:Phage integrase, partial [Acinetobacter seifertii]